MALLQTLQNLQILFKTQFALTMDLTLCILVRENLTVTTDEELKPFAPFQFKVTKIGKGTDITTGYIKDRKFSMRNWRSLGPFADCYSISKGESGVFSGPGDSGAGVFWVETDERQKPLGILLGSLPKSQLKVVCKIDKFLNALDLKIVRFVNQELNTENV